MELTWLLDMKSNIRNPPILYNLYTDTNFWHQWQFPPWESTWYVWRVTGFIGCIYLFKKTICVIFVVTSGVPFYGVSDFPIFQWIPLFTLCLCIFFILPDSRIQLKTSNKAEQRNAWLQLISEISPLFSPIFPWWSGHANKQTWWP